MMKRVMERKGKKINSLNKTVFDISIDFEKSQGSKLFDKNNGQRYLDYMSMFSSLPIGYNHDIFDEEYKNIITKISKIRMANNLFNSDELIAYRKHLQMYMRHPYTHFCSTGALSVESAMKTALYENKRKSPIFWALKKAFHGINSWGFLTDNYGSTRERINWYPRNDWENLKLEEMIELLEKKSYPTDLVGIVIEPILCTSGDIYLEPEKLIHLSKLCKENKVCFIVDEIQTGFGSSGSMWYSDSINLEYDILIFGKKSQIMGINVAEEYSSAFKTPQRILEVTFDGDLVDAIRSEFILRAYERDNLLDKAKSREEKIKSFFEDKVKNFRATGNLWAFDFESTEERDNFCQRCFQNLLLINKGGESSVRMRPNLAVSEDEIEEMKDIITRSL